jgi:hypothetical protein
MIGVSNGRADMQVTLTDADLASLGDSKLDDLYSQLALADAGTAANIGAAMESLASVRASLLAAGGATEAISLGGLIDTGKRVFNRLWSKPRRRRRRVSWASRGRLPC